MLASPLEQSSAVSSPAEEKRPQKQGWLESAAAVVT
jgi:hypothetical protein